MNKRLRHDPEIGAVVVNGTWITAAAVVAEYKWSRNYERVIARFPEITIEDIQACLEHVDA